MKKSENAAIPASAIAMLSGRHCRPSGNEANVRRNPPSNSSSTRILQVHHFPLKNGVTRRIPTVRTAVLLAYSVIRFLNRPPFRPRAFLLARGEPKAVAPPHL